MGRAAAKTLSSKGSCHFAVGAKRFVFRRRRLGAGADDLVRALANLGESDRREVVAAAERAARRQRPHVVASWRTIDAAIGVVHGAPADAVADTDELYDG